MLPRICFAIIAVTMLCVCSSGKPRVSTALVHLGIGRFSTKHFSTSWFPPKVNHKSFGMALSNICPAVVFTSVFVTCCIQYHHRVTPSNTNSSIATVCLITATFVVNTCLKTFVDVMSLPT